MKSIIACANATLSILFNSKVSKEFLLLKSQNNIDAQNV
jgi:hypothetical protein